MKITVEYYIQAIKYIVSILIYGMERNNNVWYYGIENKHTSVSNVHTPVTYEKFEYNSHFD